MENILNTVDKYIARHRLLDKECLQLVALSGGSDSVTLLSILKRLGYRIEAIHCNFHLRGEEADADEAFCKSLCCKEGIPLHISHFDTRAYAAKMHIGIEMAARELRYSFFEEQRQQSCAQAVCVAHHADDQVETLLINLLRGTGVDGLSAMQPKRDNVARPLLCLSKQQVTEYIEKNHLEYVTDSTNADTDILRNNLRHNVIPLLEQTVPNAKQSILKTIDNLQDLRAFTDQMVEKESKRIFNGSCIDLEKLEESHAEEFLLFSVLKEFHFNAATIRDIASHLHAEQGRQWFSSTHVLLLHQRALHLYTKEEIEKSEVVTLQQEYIDNFDMTLLHTKTNDRNQALVDADKIHGKLQLRHVETGEKFQPYGMKGKKLVSDFLADRHIPLVLRKNQLVVADGDNRIVWLAGREIDHNFRITPQTTRVLRLSLSVNQQKATTL